MAANRRRDTAPELALRSRLHRGGNRFRVDLPIEVPGRRPIRPDIVFPRQRVAVFVDGCFWHRCPIHGSEPRANSAYWGPKLDRNVARDRATDALLLDKGWTVVRIWEHENPDVAAVRVEAALRSERRKAAAMTAVRAR